MLFRSLTWFILAGTTHARINVVTLPDRDTVQLTIYNSADLTLVKETRHLTFRKGLNKLEFSWAGTLIDPTSVEFRALTHADEVEVLDVSFPPRVTNTLEWRIHSEVAGDVVCEIRYFTSGITWAADYVAEANKAEKLMTLAGNVRVTNHSGEDYENAQVRLVVGVIRLVEEIVQIADERADIVAITAAMLGPTGLTALQQRYPHNPLFHWTEAYILDVYFHDAGASLKASERLLSLAQSGAVFRADLAERVARRNIARQSIALKRPPPR